MRRLAGLLLLAAACSRAPALPRLQQSGYESLQQGLLQAAEASAQEGLRRSRAQRDALWERRFLVLFAEVLVESGREAEALSLLAPLAVPQAAAVEDARALMTRGRARCLASNAADDVRAAAADLARDRQIAGELELSGLTAEISRHEGTCALLRNDYAAAEELYLESHALAHAERQVFLESKAANNLGLLRIWGRRYDEAADWLTRALELASTLEGHLDVVSILTNLGWSHYMLGDYERALAVLSRAAALAETHGYEGERSYVLRNIGNVHYRRGELGVAADRYREALVTARRMGAKKLEAELLANLGTVELDERRYDEAEARVKAALSIEDELADHAGRQHSLQALGEITEARGRHAEAEALYREVLASPHTPREVLWETHGSLAGLFVATGRTAEAEREFRKAFAVMEESRGELSRSDHKISFFSSLDRLHDDYVGFLVREGRTLSALETADRSRARLLREMLESERELPRMAAARFQATARLLDAVLLFYWLAPERSFLWEVTPRDVKLHVLPAEAEIRERVEAHQALVLQGRDPLAEGSAEAAWLYATLVGPIEGRLRPGSRVVVVPDGSLHQLNLETLVAPSPRPHYWIEDVTLATAPSLSVLASGGAPGKTRAKDASILLIGDPLPAGPEFPRLAHAGKELERIGAEFEAERRAVYADERADPAAYRASEPGRYAFIHFAAHAQANREVPLESAVILSPRNEQSKLYAREIVGVPLRAELVTLSACRGAGAREFAGEGLVGLTWAFLSSGAGSVIAGLWNVEDASTADLMTGLYGRLARGQAPAEALRQAKLELRLSDAAYAKPYYWAPFVTYTRGGARR